MQFAVTATMSRNRIRTAVRKLYRSGAVMRAGQVAGVKTPGETTGDIRDKPVRPL